MTWVIASNLPKLLKIQKITKKSKKIILIHSLNQISFLATI
jgi:hypothetical protein